jgi:hypothetical protein
MNSQQVIANPIILVDEAKKLRDILIELLKNDP